MRQAALQLSLEGERGRWLLRWLPQLAEGEYRALRGLVFRSLELLGFGVAHKETNRALLSLSLSAWRNGKPLRRTSEQIAGVLQEDNGGAVRGASPDAVDRHLRGLQAIEWLHWPAPVWQHGAHGGYYSRRMILPAHALVEAVSAFLDAIINKRWALVSGRARAGSESPTPVPRSCGTKAVSGAVQDPLQYSKEGTDVGPPGSGPP